MKLGLCYEHVSTDLSFSDWTIKDLFLRNASFLYEFFLEAKDLLLSCHVCHGRR